VLCPGGRIRLIPTYCLLLLLQAWPCPGTRSGHGTSGSKSRFWASLLVRANTTSRALRRHTYPSRRACFAAEPMGLRQPSISIRKKWNASGGRVPFLGADVSTPIDHRHSFDHRVFAGAFVSFAGPMLPRTWPLRCSLPAHIRERLKARAGAIASHATTPKIPHLVWGEAHNPSGAMRTARVRTETATDVTISRRARRGPSHHVARRSRPGFVTPSMLWRRSGRAATGSSAIRSCDSVLAASPRHVALNAEIITGGGIDASHALSCTG